MDFASGALSLERRQTVEAHVAGCEDCCRVIGEVSRELELMPPRGAGDDPLAVEAPGRYEILRELGSGGQSRVFVAFDHHLRREVALKVPADDRGERFLDEARLTAQLEHPNIVAVYEIGRRQDGTPYVTQRLVRSEEGSAKVTTLRTALQRATAQVERLALLPRLAQAAEAMAYAHERGIVHRDLKPDNIVLGPHGETVVIDWGLALQLRPGADSSISPAEGQIVGTPGYMSPEQARGGAVDARTDIYALGAILFELLSGAPPPRDPNAAGLPALEPRTPQSLAAIARRALEHDPALRYANAEGFAADLSRWLSGGVVAAYDYRLVERVALALRRNRRAVLFSAAIAAVAIAAALVLLVQQRQRRIELSQTLLTKALAEQRRSAHDRAATLFAASLQLNDTPRARLGLLATLAKSRVDARTSPEGVTAIAAVAFAPVGDLIALGAQDGRVLLKAADGAITVLPRTHRDLIKALAFSPSGALLSGGDDGQIALWPNPTASEQPLALRRGRFAVNALAISRSGATAAAGMEDGHVELFSLPGGEQLARFKAHDAPVYGVSFSPSEDAVASASWDHSVKVWDLKGQPRAALEGHTDSVLSVEFDPTGAQLASASRDQTVRVWRLDGGEPVVLAGHSRKVNAVRWLNAETLASTGEDGQLRFWDAVSHTALPGATEAVDQEGLALCVSPDGGHLVVVGGRGVAWSVNTVDVAAGRNPGLWPHPRLDVHPSLGLLTAEQHGVVFRDPQTLTKRSTTRVELPSLRNARVLPDGGALLLAWNPDGGERLVRLESHGGLRHLFDSAVVRDAVVDPEGRTVAALTSTDELPLLDARTGAVVQRLSGHHADVFDVAFSDRHILAASYDKHIYVHDRQSGAVVATLKGHWHGVRSVAISPDGQLAASGGWDKTVRLWDLETFQELAALHGHEGYVSRVAFSPDGDRLASVGWDGNVIVWDVRRREELLRFVGADSRLTAVTFVGPKRLLAAGTRVVHFEERALPRLEHVFSALERRGAVFSGTDAILRPF